MGGPLARRDVLFPFLLLALIATPPAAADLPPTAAVLGLHLAADGLSWEAPGGTETLRRSLTYPAASPAASFIVPWGHLRLDHALDLRGDGAFTVWVTSDQAALLTQLRVEVYRNAALVASGTTNQRLDPDSPAAILVSPEAPRRISVGVPMRGLQFAERDAIELAVTAFGTGMNGVDAVDLLALHGSTAHPSVLTFPVADAGSLPILGRLSSLYLADDALASAPPKAERAEELHPSDGSLEQEWTWARYEVVEGFTIVADTPATLWIQTGPGATASHLRGVRVHLYVDGVSLSQTTGTFDSSSAELTAPDTQVVVGLPTAGLEVPAGSELRVAFSFLSTPDAASTNVRIVYGGPHRPSGLAFPIEVAPVAAAPIAEAPEPVEEPAPAEPAVEPAQPVQVETNDGAKHAQDAPAADTPALNALSLLVLLAFAALRWPRG